MGARQLQSGEINSRNETREAQAGSELRAGVRGLERGQPQVAAGCPRHRWPTARPGPSDPARDCVGPSPRRPCPSLQAGNGGGQVGLMGCQQMRRGAGVRGGAGVGGEGPALGGARAVLREGPALGGGLRTSGQTRLQAVAQPLRGTATSAVYPGAREY